MLTVQGYNISLTRGDTATLEITFTGDVPTATDTVIAAIKRNANRKGGAVWEKTLTRQQNGAYLLELASADTNDMQAGDYYWDMRIIYSDGQITTPFTPAIFHVIAAVTDIPQDGDGE